MTGAVGRCCDYRAMRRTATLAALVIAAPIALSTPAGGDPAGDPGDVQTLTPPHPSQVELDERFLDDLGLGGIRVTSVKQVLGDAHQICAIRKAGSTEAQVVTLAMSENATLTQADAQTLVDSAEGVYCPQLSKPGTLA
jgi:hypothetical protein